MICYKCKNQVMDGSGFCPYCGANLKQPQNMQYTANNLNNENVNSNLNNNLNNESNNNSNKNLNNKRNNSKYSIIIIFLIIIIGIIIFSKFLNKKDNSNVPSDNTNVPNDNTNVPNDNTNVPSDNKEEPFLMAIEDVFTITGRGTVVTGRVERGQLKLNDEIEIVGINKTIKTVVTEIEKFSKFLESAKEGDIVGLLLKNINRSDVQKGQVIAKPKSITSHVKFKCEIKMLSKEEGGRHVPFLADYRPQFYFRTMDFSGSIELPKGIEMVMPGDNVSLTVKLTTPVAMEKGTEFKIRENGKYVGYGVVTEIIE